MKLGEILRSQGKPSIAHPVSFTVVGENEKGQRIKATARATLLPITEQQREDLRVEARAEVTKRYGDKPVPPSVFADEETFHRLFRALHQAEPTSAGSYGPFADNVLELRHALVLDEARRLDSEYERFMAAEFPPKISDEDFEKLIDAAKKNSANDLLTSFGFEKAVLALSSLAARSGK